MAKHRWAPMNPKPKSREPKWKRFVGKVPEFKEAPDVQQRVDAAKRALIGTRSGRNANAALLSRLYAERYIERKKVESRLSVLNTEMTALKQLLRDRSYEEDLQSIKLNSGIGVGFTFEPVAMVVDRTAAFRWINAERKRGNDLGYLVTIQHQSMNAFVKERMQAGLPVPPGIGVWMMPKVSVRGVKQSAQTKGGK